MQWRDIAATSKGVLCLLLVILLAGITIIPVMLLTLLKFLLPPLRNPLTQAVTALVEGFTAICRRLYFLIHRPGWDVVCNAQLSRKDWYLIICNHQAWADIPILVFTLDGRVPFYKFFIKRQLLWVPFIGAAAWAMDFPFMQRYSKQQLAENPALRGRDAETTRLFCEKLRRHPASVINYLEGTRFTPQKHRAQRSPYKYLLRPKAGGVAYVIRHLNERMNRLLDVTIVYREEDKRFWRFLCGQLSDVRVDISVRQFPAHLLGADYRQSETDRAAYKAWVEELWSEKDALIAQRLTSS